MVISPGEKVHIITRRQFDGDLRRHFAGIVEEVEGSHMKVRGFAFIFDESTNEFVRREEERIRIVPLSDAGLIINVLPLEVDINELKYRIDRKGRRIITDGGKFSLNITEFGAKL